MSFRNRFLANLPWVFSRCGNACSTVNTFYRKKRKINIYELTYCKTRIRKMWNDGGFIQKIRAWPTTITLRMTETQVNLVKILPVYFIGIFHTFSTIISWPKALSILAEVSVLLDIKIFISIQFTLKQGYSYNIIQGPVSYTHLTLPTICSV